MNCLTKVPRSKRSWNWMTNSNLKNCWRRNYSTKGYYLTMKSLKVQNCCWTNCWTKRNSKTMNLTTSYCCSKSYCYWNSTRRRNCWSYCLAHCCRNSRKTHSNCC
jgi:hypothetical protein